MAKESNGTLTTEQAKARLERRGISITQWARENNFPYQTVIQVLNGFAKGHRGKARKVAIALGIRAPNPERDAA